MSQATIGVSQKQIATGSTPSQRIENEASPARHLLSITDLTGKDLAWLVDRATKIASNQVSPSDELEGKIIGLYFRAPSTRTRSSFSVGALRSGAKIVSYGPEDLQLITGETIEDTARVLSGYLDAIVVRTNGSIEEMKALASQHEMAVINAMSENEHPTQAIADLSTLKERFGRLDGLHLLYLGEGNNTAAALALAVAATHGMKATFITPAGYGLQEGLLDHVLRSASQNGAVIECSQNIDELPQNVDAVYATRWQTMGVPHSTENWIEIFRPYCVTPQIMKKVSKPDGTVFLHDLPAVRGEDVHSEVIDGPQSLVWRQARHKMYSAMAIMEWCLKQGPQNGRKQQQKRRPPRSLAE